MTPQFMHELLEILTIAGVSFGASTMGTMGCGGSSMITTPTWIMLGFPLPVAIASNTFNGCFSSITAARTYLRNHDLDWPLAAGLIGCGLLGAYFGTRAILLCNPHYVQRVIGGIILTLVVVVFFRKDFGQKERQGSLNRAATSVAALPLGFYEAFFGSANGLFTSAMLAFARGYQLLRALGYYYLMSWVWCIFATTLYFHAGKCDLFLMVPAAVGSTCGAMLGSRIGVRQGAGFVRLLFLAAGTIMGTKLLLSV